MSKPLLSVIIPTYNEEAHLPFLLRDLYEFFSIELELIIADGGSQDGTLSLASKAGIKVLQSPKGRAVQMNYAAKQATAEYLLFLHADVRLNQSIQSDVLRLIQEKRKMASWGIELDKRHWFTDINFRFSKINHPYFYFGDQGLFTTKSLFNSLNGYDEGLDLLEDQNLFQKAFKLVKPLKLKGPLIVSARKYEKYGHVKLQLFFYKLWLLYKLGISNSKISKVYANFLERNSISD